MAESGPVFELRIALTVEDFDRAIAFYRDALGLTESALWESKGGKAALLQAGKATIELLSPQQAAEVDRIEAGQSASARLRFAMEVADSAAMAERLAEAGGGKAGPVVETPWGHRNVRLSTPEGIPLTLFTVMKKK